MKKRSNSILICFTASYPYGLHETFFENELPYLAEGFSKVIIFPNYNPTGNIYTRSLPNNVTFFTPFVSSNKMKRVYQGIFNFSPLQLYVKDFFNKKVYKSSKVTVNWFNSLITFRRTYSIFKNYLKENKDLFNNNNIICYAYWAEAPLFTTKQLKPFKKVVRMHRVDFYLEVNNGYLPIRKQIYEAADLLIPISENILGLLKSDYHINEEKILLNRLGVSNTSKKNPDGSKEDTVTVVSCSRVDPVKRLSLLVKALSSYEGDKKIIWHHFGDGKLFHELKMKVVTLPKSISVMLHGWTKQEDLFSFYKENNVNWFVNVSESEGIPVSIMEAMSFGIPVIATNVGGTSEIVNTRNGFLLDSAFEDEQLIKCILSVNSIEYTSKRKEAYNTWFNNFRAEKNYKALVDILLSI